MENVINKILTDIKVDLSDEFDRNFERKAFFSKKWPNRKMDGPGSVMLQTGKLRRSIRAKVGNDSVTWSTSEPYASIHNEGGTITVTRKMKRYFWAKFYELAGKVRYRKNGKESRTSAKVSKQAEMYRALALMKVGDKITIPQRQFLGDAPEIRSTMKKIINDGMREIPKRLIKQRLNNK